MTYDLGAVYDGIFKGTAILRPEQAESKPSKKGTPCVNVSYVILEAEPQGEKGVDVSGEIVFHSLYFPTSETSPKGRNFMLRNVKAFVRKHFGEDAAESNLSVEDIVNGINENKNAMSIPAILSEEEYEGKLTQRISF